MMRQMLCMAMESLSLYASDVQNRRKTDREQGRYSHEQIPYLRWPDCWLNGNRPMHQKILDKSDGIRIHTDRQIVSRVDGHKWKTPVVQRLLLKSPSPASWYRSCIKESSSYPQILHGRLNGRNTSINIWAAFYIFDDKSMWVPSAVLWGLCDIYNSCGIIQ